MLTADSIRTSQQEFKPGNGKGRLCYIVTVGQWTESPWIDLQWQQVCPERDHLSRMAGRQPDRYAKPCKIEKLVKRTDFPVGITLTIFATIMAVHNLYPSLRAYTTPFFQMSYYQPSTGRYRQGWDDVYLVISSIIGFTAARAIAIDWIFCPMAKRNGLKKKAALRFAEQAWMVVYYGIFWTLGMVSP